jgi:uncharacterized repeat protein (TIGR03803 family)
MKASGVMKCLLGIGLALCTVIVKGQYAKLIDFTGPNGNGPVGPPVLVDSFIYGTTSAGGSNHAGLIYRINKNSHAYEKLHEFNQSDGFWPNTMVFKDGALFGVTGGGGEAEGDSGTIFKINLDGTGFKNVFQFNSLKGSVPQWCTPIIERNTMYGLTTSGGSYTGGVLYRVDTNGTGYTVLHNFDYASGCSPKGSLMMLGDTLYGITTAGNTKENGSIFRINKDGTGYTVLMEFESEYGADPSPLTLHGRTLYGMTLYMLYQIGVDGKNYKEVLDLKKVNAYNPYVCSLIIADSIIYGVTNNGGMGMSNGVVFRVDLSGENEQMLFYFNGNKGAFPNGSLILDNKTLYGVTSQGGSNDMGVLYKWTLCHDTTITNEAYLSINGELLLPDGTIAHDSGTYVSNLFSLFGCDSTIITHITLLECRDTTINVDIAIADNGVYELPDGNSVLDAGTYYSTLPGINGCDSTIVTHITILECSDITTVNNVILTINEEYTLPDGTVVDESGTYTNSYKSISGCDSIIITNITRLNCVHTTLQIDTSLSGNASYALPDGEMVWSAGIYVDTLVNANGCYCIITTNLRIGTGMIVSTKSKTSIHPVPANEYVVIHTDLSNYTVTVLDMTGKAILTKEFHGNENTLEVASLKEGLYFLLITYPGGNETLKMNKTNK